MDDGTACTGVALFQDTFILFTYEAGWVMFVGFLGIQYLGWWFLPGLVDSPKLHPVVRENRNYASIDDEHIYLPIKHGDTP